MEDGVRAGKTRRAMGWIAATAIALLALPNPLASGGEMIARPPDEGLLDSSKSLMLVGPAASKAARLLRDANLRRLAPIEVAAGAPEMLVFLLRHPHVASELWRDMGVEVAPVTRRSDGGYDCSEEEADLTVHVVHRTSGLDLFYVVAETRAGFLPQSLSIEMLLVARHKRVDRDGREYLVHQLEAYLGSDQRTVRWALNVGSGTAKAVLDRALADLTLYFSLLHRILSYDPDWGLRTTQSMIATQPSWTPELEELKKMLVAIEPSATSGDVAEFWREIGLAPGQTAGK